MCVYPEFGIQNRIWFESKPKCENLKQTNKQKKKTNKKKYKNKITEKTDIRHYRHHLVLLRIFPEVTTSPMEYSTGSPS
jgi:hypothetical protein